MRQSGSCGALAPTILVVDDNTDVRNGVALLLEGSGYGVVACVDPEAAIEACECYHPDGALVDLCYSGAFGYEGLSLVESIRAMLPSAPIVAMSGDRSPGLGEEAVKRGASAFLAKPFDLDALATVLPAHPADASGANIVHLPSIDEILGGGILTTWFQAIVDLRADRLLGWECLARVATAAPFRSPSSLFRYARRKGRLADLNRACVAEALRAGASLAGHGTLFLNVDPEVLALGPAFADFLAAEARRNGVDPHALVCEVTERSELAGDAPLAAVRALRALGVSIALDDVGIGYAHFAHLEAMQPSFLKIPLELGTGLSGAPSHRAVVMHLAGMARDLGCRVIVEGMETAADVRAARDLGIDLAQGYFFGQAAPAGAWRTLVHSA